MGWPFSTTARSPAAARVHPAHGAPRHLGLALVLAIVLVGALLPSGQQALASQPQGPVAPSDDIRARTTDLDRPVGPRADELRERIEARLEPGSTPSGTTSPSPSPQPPTATADDTSTLASQPSPPVERADAEEPREEAEVLRQELDPRREAIEAPAAQQRADADAQTQGDAADPQQLPDIAARVRDRTDAIGAGKIIVCKIVAGTRGDGAGLCDGRPGSLLAGAVFELRDATGERVGTCTSRLDGACIFFGLPFGTYQVVEVIAPRGYQLDPAPRTIAPSQGELRPRLFVENAPLPEPPGPTDPEPPGPEEPSSPDPEPPTPDPGTPDPETPTVVPDPDPTEPTPEQPSEVLPQEPIETEDPDETPGDPDDTDATIDEQRIPTPDTAVLGLARTGAPVMALLIASLLAIAVGFAGTRWKRPEAS